MNDASNNNEHLTFVIFLFTFAG